MECADAEPEQELPESANSACDRSRSERRRRPEHWYIFPGAGAEGAEAFYSEPGTVVGAGILLIEPESTEKFPAPQP